jgi:hypothetical protein
MSTVGYDKVFESLTLVDSDATHNLAKALGSVVRAEVATAVLESFTRVVGSAAEEEIEFLISVRGQEVITELWDIEKRVEEWKKMTLEISERLEPSPEKPEEEWDYVDEEYVKRKLALLS